MSFGFWPQNVVQQNALLFVAWLLLMLLAWISKSDRAKKSVIVLLIPVVTYIPIWVLVAFLVTGKAV